MPNDDDRALIGSMRAQINILATLCGALLGIVRSEGLIGPDDEETLLSSIERAARDSDSKDVTKLIDAVRNASLQAGSKDE